jgi:hypothetical protein
VPQVGVEPTTKRFRGVCSTSELQGQITYFLCFSIHSSKTRKPTPKNVPATKENNNISNIHILPHKPLLGSEPSLNGVVDGVAQTLKTESIQGLDIPLTNLIRASLYR